MLAGVKFRALKTDSAYKIHVGQMKKAIAEDKAKGLIPFYLMVSFGTTSACSFDNLEALGPICKENNMWAHVDAAYAGRCKV